MNMKCVRVHKTNSLLRKHDELKFISLGKWLNNIFRTDKMS